MTNWAIIFPIISFISFGIVNAMSKTMLKKVDSEIYIFYRNLGVTILNIFIVLITIRYAVFDLKTILFGLFISAVSYIGYFSFTKGVTTGKVSVVVPIANARVIVTALVAVFFLGEKLIFAEYLAIFIVFAGVVLNSINLRDLSKIEAFNLKSGVPQAILAAVIWGISFAYFAEPSMILGSFLFSLIVEGTILLCVSMQLVIKGTNPIKKFSAIKSDKILYIITIISATAGTLCFNLGYDYLKVSTVGAITSASPLVSIIYAKIFQKEKIHLQQIISAVLIIGGIATLSYFG